MHTHAIRTLCRWASDEMHSRLDANAVGPALVTLTKSDFEAAILRFSSVRPPTKEPALVGGEQVEGYLRDWALSEYAPLFVRQVKM